MILCNVGIVLYIAVLIRLDVHLPKMVDFTEFPFGLPATSTNAAMVNEILAESFRLQREIRMSNSCAFVNIILQRCFSAAKLETKLVYGTLRFPSRSIILPHVWLTIDGRIVDNTVAENMLDDRMPAELPIISRQYVSQEPTETSHDLFLGDESTRKLGIPDHDIKAFTWGLTNPERALALARNNSHISLYYEKLTESMKKKYKVEVPKIETFDTTCWTCQRSRIPLKTCS